MVFLSFFYRLYYLLKLRTSKIYIEP